MSSEKDFGVSEQPCVTCPMINSVIKSINSALCNIKGWDYDPTIEDLKDKCSNVEDDLWSLVSEMEDIRKNVELIREWGQEWKDLAKSFDKKLMETA